MKHMMELEMIGIESVLNRSNLSKEDRQAIRDAYKEICHRWCHSNALSCAFEETLKQATSEETMQAFYRVFIPMSFGFVNQKMIETYPWYEEEFGEEDDEAY